MLQVPPRSVGRQVQELLLGTVGVAPVALATPLGTEATCMAPNLWLATLDQASGDSSCDELVAWISAATRGNSNLCQPSKGVARPSSPHPGRRLNGEQPRSQNPTQSL
jgi:hypothetical protein